MTSSFDVIVAGSYSIDFIFTGMDEIPQLGKDIHSKAFHVTPGEAYIAAVSMHRLGIKVGWATDFGNDEYSQLALKHSRQEGLDESLFVFHDHPYNRVSVAFSNPDERGFITYYDPDPKIPAALLALAKAQSKYFFIPGLFSGRMFEHGAKLARLKKMKIVMDGNSTNGNILGKTKDCKAIYKAIASTDFFLPNSQEAMRLTGTSDISSAIKHLGKITPQVVIKDGKNGSIALNNNKIIHMPGIQVSPVDTTGAGDNFNAGFMRAVLDGLSIEKSLIWGNIIGGLSTTEIGGTSRIVTLDIINEAITRFYPDYINIGRLS